MNVPKIQVILGSTRDSRNGEKVARFFMEAVKDNGRAEVELVDLKEYNLPFFQDAMSPMMREGKHEDTNVEKWLNKINEADAYVFVTAEYNASIPAPLKNAIDFGYKEWNNKYAGFVSYGALTGGVRAVEHLRLVLANLKMFTINEKITIPNIWAAFDAEGKLVHGDDMAKTANAMIDELAKYSMTNKMVAAGGWPTIKTEIVEAISGK